jgi:oxygen-independent coproporphyrinogen-3 oxidase
MEANPGTVECGAPAGYRDAGVNRLSIGGQSFNDELLKKIGRIHSSADIVRAVNEAHAAGIDDVNIDLMHGLPGQSISAALEDVRAAMDLSPSHISWYELTLEPNTVFHARPPDDLPDDEMAAEMQRRGRALLARHGYRQYEVSAYARENRVCRHNLNYWRFGDYLAVGAGAHGKVSGPSGAFRYVKPANPRQYMETMEARQPLWKQDPITKEDLVFEFMLNALRLNDGFREADFCDRTGQSAEQLAQIMHDVSQKGLVWRDDSAVWRTTPIGKLFLNDLQAEFLPKHP